MAREERTGALGGLREALAPLARRLAWSKPATESDLRYTILPPYEIPGIIVITGLLVENLGDEAARNVRIEVSYDGTAVAMIHHMQVMSDEDYILRGGGEQHAFATIRLRAMSPGSKVFIYMATSDTVEPEVKVSSFERNTG
jgi:hypothetical protein